MAVREILHDMTPARRLQNIDGQSIAISDKLNITVVINKAVKIIHIMNHI